MEETLTQEDLGLILSYVLIYQDLLEKEETFNKFSTYGMKLDYLNVHAHYERSMGTLVMQIPPIELIEKLRHIRRLCKDIEADIAENFSLQSSEE